LGEAVTVRGGFVSTREAVFARGEHVDGKKVKRDQSVELDMTWDMSLGKCTYGYHGLKSRTAYRIIYSSQKCSDMLPLCTRLVTAGDH